MIGFPPIENIKLNPLRDSEGGRGRFRTACSVPVYFGLPVSGRFSLLVIPPGFVTDGASIPRFARPFFDPWGRVGLAALLHDYLLTLPDVAKWQADLLFLDALRSQGVPAFQATLMYFAVRMRRPPRP